MPDPPAENNGVLILYTFSYKRLAMRADPPTGEQLARCMSFQLTVFMASDPRFRGDSLPVDVPIGALILVWLGVYDSTCTYT